MFDDDHLGQSGMYFSLMQLIRIFSASIRRSMADFESLVQEAQDGQDGPMPTMNPEPNNSDDVAVVRKNWDVILTRKRTIVGELLDRLSTQMTEIERLQDGVSAPSQTTCHRVVSNACAAKKLPCLGLRPLQLFNAVSVRETVKGTKINQYLLVFTIVTILYLPPTFVAVSPLFRLPN
jgi:hypothetical protein